MIKHQGIMLPAGEAHLQGWMDRAGEMVDGRGTYQIKKLRAAVAHVRSFRTAVDIGAHVGMWTMQLAKRFKEVHSFEPVAAHRACFEENMRNLLEDQSRGGGFILGAHMLHACALGAENGKLVRIETTPGSSGDSRVGGEGDIPLFTLDSFELKDVDFMKLDCEGYELFALKGAEQTIRRDLPVIIVEQKPGRGQRFGLPETGAVEWLMSLGYKCVEKLSGDFVMVPA